MPSFKASCILLWIAFTSPKTWYKQSNAFVNASEEEELANQLTLTLKNEVKIPLIALGLGEVETNVIPDIISIAAREDVGYDLIDTDHESKNEEIISESFMNENRKDVEMITKVWYTHLGYERTKISIKESLFNVREHVKIHMLLHWPRCDDEIEWMNCQKEEDELPSHVQKAGPSPLQNPYGEDAAWKGSWKAMEEMYVENDQIVSIGVSNFLPDDMVELVDEVANIGPHLYQGHIVQRFLQPDLIRILADHDIAFQAYHVMRGVFSKIDERPWARHHLERIALDLSRQDDIISWPRLVLGFLTQHNVAVTVRATQEQHIYENSPMSIRNIPKLNEAQSQEMTEIIETILQDKDVPEPSEEDKMHLLMRIPLKATFHNKLKDTPVDVFWVNEDTGERVSVGSDFEPGGSYGLHTYRGHKFVAESKDGRSFDFIVRKDVHEENFSIEL